MIPKPRTSQRGFTLTEMMVVLVLAAILMTGMTTFYYHSQAMWLEGASQALTQREATLAVETMRDSVHHASSAVIVSPQEIALLDAGGQPFHFFMLNQSDRTLVHGATQLRMQPLIQSPVERFEVEADNDVVRLVALELLTERGQIVRTSSTFAFMNR